MKQQENKKKEGQSEMKRRASTTNAVLQYLFNAVQYVRGAQVHIRAAVDPSSRIPYLFGFYY